MSAFIKSGVAGGGARFSSRRGLNQNDDVGQQVDYSDYSLPGMLGGRSSQEVDILWTRANFPTMLSSGAQLSPENSMSQWWEYYWPPTGGQVRKKVIGTVVDSNGNPVSGATVRLFNTATGLLVDTQTSAADGSYTCGDPNAVSCFAVGYLPDSPDTEGTTVNTLTGS